MGGEKSCCSLSFPRGGGSPPRGRGKVDDPEGGDLVHRITPAWAGKSGRRSSEDARYGITPAWAGKRRAGHSVCSSSRDHPRVGGEKELAEYVAYCWAGSPPRGRGKEGPTFFVKVRGRITPAWAGKSREWRHFLKLRWDHPRVGGEKIPASIPSPLKKGSPPRGRGKVDK